MRRLKDRSLVPPGQFRFTHETGFTSTAPTYDDWVAEAKKHRKANNLDIPLDFVAKMEDQLCGLIPPDRCERDEGDPAGWVDTNFSWADFREGMGIFTEWGSQGAPLVEEKEAERRAHLCVACPLNVNVSGCATCHKIASYLTGAVAEKKTPYADNLRACAICHCSLQAMVWFPMDLLASRETADRQAVRPNFCWVKQGRENYVTHSATIDHSAG